MGETDKVSGPLSGLTVVEMAGLGPAPLACLMLAEMGARVIRIERLATDRPFLGLPPEQDLDRHGRIIVRTDLKAAEGRDLVAGLVGKADVLVEGFRPGVMERLGLGPDDCSAANPRLVYARMTGFGQKGPLASRAGHDLTYLATTGVLHAIGPAGQKPVPPLNLVADYGGGTMFLLTGILAALVERSVSGRGQVVDAAMIDGASMLAAPFFSFMAAGIWTEKRGANLLDGGAPFYDTYATADGRHVAVACLEPQFFAEFASIIGLPEEFVRGQFDRTLWDRMRTEIATRLAAESMTHWADRFAATDACVAPVLTFGEATTFPQNEARRMYSEKDGWLRPKPAPRLSRTPAQIAAGAKTNEPAVDELLATFGYDGPKLRSNGIIG